MKIVLCGSSLSVAFAAVFLSERYKEIEWNLTPSSKSFRPFVLESTGAQFLRNHLGRRRLNYGYFADAPRVPREIYLSDKPYYFQKSWFPKTSSVYLDRESLFQTLLMLAKSLGVQVKECEILPSIQLHSNSFHIVDASAKDLEFWSHAYKWNELQQSRVFSQEVWLPVVSSDQAQRHVIEKYPGTLASLVPHPEKGQVLSLVSKTKLALDRTWDRLNNLRAIDSSPIRAAVLVNASPRIISRECFIGANPYTVPGAFHLGEAIGSYSASGHVDDMETLINAHSLGTTLSQQPQAVLFSQKLKLSDDWTQKVNSRFQSLYSMTHFFEEMLYKDSTRKLFLTASQYGPRHVSQYLGISR